jgi:putative addiction module component (TIGR02574 family)
MSVLIEEITEAALSLSHDEQAILVERLNENLDAARPQMRLSDAWRTEIRRRVTQVEAGEVELIDGPEGFRRVREALRK